MDGFVAYAAAKRGMGEALQAVMASDSAIYAEAYAKLVGALDALLAAASAAGTIRPDARGEDVLRALGAIWMIRDSANREEQAERVLELLMDGLRYDPSRAPCPADGRSGPRRQRRQGRAHARSHRPSGRGDRVARRPHEGADPPGDPAAVRGARAAFLAGWGYGSQEPILARLSDADAGCSPRSTRVARPCSGSSTTCTTSCS